MKGRRRGRGKGKVAERGNDKVANDASTDRDGQESNEVWVRRLVASSKPAPEVVKDEVGRALDRLGVIFRVDEGLVSALKEEMEVRLLTGESPDFFLYRVEGRPQRLMLLNFIEENGRYRVDARAVFEECAHALRSVFHPIENALIREFIGALGPVLALDRRTISGGPMLDAVETLWTMRRRGGSFEGIPDALASKMQKYLPPGMATGMGAGGDNERIASAFLENAVTHMMPTIAAESMADTGWLAELMGRYQLLSLPAKEISEILNEYTKRCVMDPEWKEKYKGFRKVCGYYLKT